VRDNFPLPLNKGEVPKAEGVRPLPNPPLVRGGGNATPLFSSPLIKGEAGWGSYFYNFNSFIIFSITPFIFLFISAFVKRKTFIFQTFEISTSYTVIFF